RPSPLPAHHAPKRSCRERSPRPELASYSSGFCSGGGAGSFLQQLSNALGRLGTLGQPVVGTFLVDGQLHFTASGDRVEEADALDETAVARIAAVGHDQVVEGALLGAATGETDGYHVNFVPVVGAAKNRCNAGARPERPRILRNIPAIANGFCGNSHSLAELARRARAVGRFWACARSMIRQANHQNFGMPPGNMPPMPRMSLA